VEALPLSAFAMKAKMPPALLLGYAVVPEAQIVEGVRRLANVLRSEDPAGKPAR
jgi:DNA-binding transcriptional MocR family regulator